MPIVSHSWIPYHCPAWETPGQQRLVIVPAINPKFPSVIRTCGILRIHKPKSNSSCRGSHPLTIA